MGGGERQHATTVPRVRSNRETTNCNPIPRDAPVTTNTAPSSEFRATVASAAAALDSSSKSSRRRNSMSGKTGTPCDFGGSGASKEEEDEEEEEDDDEDALDECDRAAAMDGRPRQLSYTTKAVRGEG